MYTKHQAIKQLNKWGGQKQPFFFMIDFELEKPLLFPLDKIPPHIAFDINGVKRGTFLPVETHGFFFEKKPVSKAVYKVAYDQVMQELRYGNSYLLNLTFPTEIKTNLMLNTIFSKSKAPYKLCVNSEFVVFSPEPFIKIKNGLISSFPMKGTMDASIPNAKEKLLTDVKEQAEHATIVDLIRNDLSKVATEIKVVEYRYVEEVKTFDKTLLQASSKIEGRLPENYWKHLGEIIFSLLPAGSISGAPKKKTIEIIKNAEKQDRGYFTGVMGVFDGLTLDSGVLIRYIEQKSDKLAFRSGGGITAQSEITAEYQELLDKVYVPFN